MEVFNAFRGEAVDLEGAEISSLDALKTALQDAENIDPAHMLILLSPQGQQLKVLGPEDAKRALLYDKSWTEQPPENRVDLDDDIFSGSSALAMRAFINKTTAENKVILEAADTVVRYLRLQLRGANKALKRQQAFKSELADDVAACAQWEHYWDATSRLKAIGEQLVSLLDRDTISRLYGELQQAWESVTQQLDTCLSLSSSLDRECDGLAKMAPNSAASNRANGHGRPHAGADRETDERYMDEQFRAVTDAKTDAQSYLLDALRKISDIQQRLAVDLRKPIAGISEDLRKIDALKGKIAEVIDLPFLHGVLLIEMNRREKWESDIDPFVKREVEREREWQQRYTQGLVGEMMNRLSEITGLELSSSPLEAVQQKIRPNGGLSTSAADRVAEYLADLRAVGLSEVDEDLGKELGAMQRQLARSMSASISSLVPSISGPHGFSPGPAAKDPSPSALPENARATYEARINKLETELIRARLTAKNHETDLIRAEARGEARAEARAEINVEKMTSQITELEKTSHELTSRLRSYTSGLETILNSMGLQTLRVDLETGEPVYRVNRVKGLSRRTSPPSVSSEQASAASQITAGSTQHDDVPRQISLEKLLDITHIDNQVLYEAMTKRFGDVERLARKLQSENRTLKERYAKIERDCRQRVALHSFHPEDLILFLPTRESRRQPNPWAAFNAGAPHYFLHPRYAEHLKGREFLIARASEVERRVVSSEADDNNPFGLANGVEWFLITIHGEWGV